MRSTLCELQGIVVNSEANLWLLARLCASMPVVACAELTSGDSTCDITWDTWGQYRRCCTDTPCFAVFQVILDVVFNHTAEGNEKGPTLSFRGLDNRVYYMLAPLGEYYNYR